MKIEVGKEYINRNGDIIRIVSSDDSSYDDKKMLFYDQDGDSYFENGNYWEDGFHSCNDLIGRR